MNTLARLDIEPLDPVARAHSLAEPIERAADEIEQSCTIPEPLLTRLHEARMMRLLLPASVGGEEISPVVYLKTLETLGYQDASVAWNVFVGNSSALIAAYLEPFVARTIFSDPRTVVSWGPPNACHAQAVRGGYRVSGQWHFASGCRQANWMGVHCPVLEIDGSIREIDGRVPITTLLFPVTKARLLHDWNPIGLRGTGSDSYRLDDVFISESFCTTREEPGLCREPGRLYRFTMQGIYAVGVAGVALGIARRMLDAFCLLAQSKTPRGQSRLADSAGVQAGFARREAGLAAARAWLIGVLDDIYNDTKGIESTNPAVGAPPETVSERNDDSHAEGVARPISLMQRGQLRLACIQTITQAIEAADWTYKAAGVSAIFPGSPFERRFRDIHTLSQQIQSREAHFESVGQILLGARPAVFY